MIPCLASCTTAGDSIPPFGFGNPGRDTCPVNVRISVLTVREVPDLRQRLDAT